jgi:hypothetical protein
MVSLMTESALMALRALRYRTSRSSAAPAEEGGGGGGRLLSAAAPAGGRVGGGGERKAARGGGGGGGGGSGFGPPTSSVARAQRRRRPRARTSPAGPRVPPRAWARWSSGTRPANSSRCPSRAARRRLPEARARGPSSTTVENPTSGSWWLAALPAAAGRSPPFRHLPARSPWTVAAAGEGSRESCCGAADDAAATPACPPSPLDLPGRPRWTGRAFRTARVVGKQEGAKTYVRVVRGRVTRR